MTIEGGSPVNVGYNVNIVKGSGASGEVCVDGECDTIQNWRTRVATVCSGGSGGS